MRLSTVVRVGVVAAMGVAVLVIGASKSLDIARTKAFLSAEVKALTGRELTIAGSLRLRVGLVPVLIAEGVSLANIDGGSRADMVRVDRVEAELALIPLIRHEIRVLRIIVSSPDIVIETDGKGRGNWVPTPAPESTRAKSVAQTRFNLREFRIKNARVTYRDRGDGREEVFNIHKLALQPDRAGTGPMNVQVVGDHLGKTFEVTGSLGHPSAIGKGAPWPIRLKASGHGMQWSVDGGVMNPFTGTGLDLKLSAQGDDVTDVTRLAGLRLPAVGPFRITARVINPRDQVTLGEIDMALGRRDGLFLSAKGIVRDVLGKPETDLAVSAESDSLAGLLRLAGVETTLAGPFRGSVLVRNKGIEWHFSDIKASGAGSDLVGQVGWVASSRPRASLQFTLNTLALGAISDAALRASPPLASPPLAFLQQLDADVTAHIGTLSVWGVRLTDTAFGLRLERGRLNVSPFSSGLAGGALTGTLDVQDFANGGRMAVALEARHVELGRLLTSLGFVGYEGGRGDMATTLRGRGPTLAAWLASLRGQIRADVAEGRLPAPVQTEMRCAAARLSVKDGIATADRGVAFESDRWQLLGGGSVDLAAGHLDFHLQPAGSGEHDLIVSGAVMAPTVAWSETPKPAPVKGSACQVALGR